MESIFKTPNFFSAEALARWENFTKASVESGKQLESLNLKLAEKLMHKQAELFNNAVNAGNQIAALWSEGKPLPEILTAQAKLVNDCGSKVFAATREAAEIVAGSHEEYRHWFAKGFKHLTEQSKAAAAAITPAISRLAA